MENAIPTRRGLGTKSVQLLEHVLCDGDEVSVTGELHEEGRVGGTYRDATRARARARRLEQNLHHLHDHRLGPRCGRRYPAPVVHRTVAPQLTAPARFEPRNQVLRERMREQDEPAPAQAPRRP